MSTALRLGAVAFCCDFSLYVIMSALPFRLLELGAGSLWLGAVPALYAGPYSVVVLFFGARSDAMRRSTMIRVGVAIAAIGALVLSQSDQLLATALAIPILSLGSSLIWPSVQAGFAEIDAGRRLSRQVGIYNLSWSSGKGLGFLVGGALVATIGPDRAMWVSAGCYALACLAVPGLQRAGLHELDHGGRSERLLESERAAFRRAAWAINGIAFGVGAVFNHHLPKILVARGEDAARFGQLLGAIFLAQTASFLLLARWRGWHYRLRDLLAVQALLAALAVVAVASTSSWILFGAAVLLGASLGFSYQSSLYYSLHAPSGRGRQAGIHEASLGVASALLPFAGGLAARASGDLRAPFLLASLAVATAAVLALLQIRRARGER